MQPWQRAGKPYGGQNAERPQRAAGGRFKGPDGILTRRHRCRQSPAMPLTAALAEVGLNDLWRASDLARGVQRQAPASAAIAAVGGLLAGRP